MSAEQNEFEFIEWIRARVPDHPRLALGIGDDVAALRISQSANCLSTVDMLMEGVHFTIPPATARDIGRKALAVNLSDIAAMAGKPIAVVVSVALPRNRGAGFARDIHEGLVSLAEEFDVAVAGGDTNSWDGPLVISVTLIGEAAAEQTVRRNGAIPGDWILCTGSFGGSLLGKHLSFQPRVREALRLQEAVAIHAMIDVSDGLAADLHHILDESETGAVLNANLIPISIAARNMNDGKSPLEHALGDGEDFELLFTVSEADGRKLLEHPLPDVELTHIGDITDEPGCELVDSSGVRKPLPPAGWTHKLREDSD